MGDPASRFGNSGTLTQLGDASTQGGSRLDELKKLLDSDVQSLVPERWDGRASNAFDRFVSGFWDKMGATSGLAREWAAELREVAGLLALAKAMFEEARTIGLPMGICVNEELVAVPCSPGATIPDYEVKREMVQGRVTQAWGMAEEARARLRATNERLRAEAAQLHGSLTAEYLVGMFGGGSAFGRRGKTTGTMRWPKAGTYRTKAQYGTAFHSAMAKLQRAQGQASMVDKNWKVAKIEQTVGGTKRVDAMYINETEKKVFIEDYYTGPVEPDAHAFKTGSYLGEPEIQALRADGWEVQSGTSFSDWRRLH